MVEIQQTGSEPIASHCTLEIELRTRSFGNLLVSSASFLNVYCVKMIADPKVVVIGLTFASAVAISSISHMRIDLVNLVATFLTFLS